VLLWVPLQIYQHLETICCSIFKGTRSFLKFIILQINIILPYNVGRDSFLSLYSDLLWAGRSRDRIPLGGRFSAPIQTCPVSQPASNTIGTGSFPGVKRPGRGVNHPPHLAPRLKKDWNYISTSSSWASWTVLGWISPLPFIFLLRVQCGILACYCLTIMSTCRTEFVNRTKWCSIWQPHVGNQNV
jgi:hypothetical protein